MRFSVTLIMTLMLFLIAASFSHAEDIERITVTGKRHHWPDYNVRNFYIHHASRSGLKKVPTASDFENFNDDKARACFKGQMEIKKDVAECKNIAQAASGVGTITCSAPFIKIPYRLVQGIGIALCGTYFIYKNNQALSGCDLMGERRKFEHDKANKCD